MHLSAVLPIKLTKNSQLPFALVKKHTCLSPAMIPLAPYPSASSYPNIFYQGSIPARQYVYSTLNVPITGGKAPVERKTCFLWP